MSVATMGWILRPATRKPLNAPHRQATRMPARMPSHRGMAYSLTLTLPKPASSTQHTPPASDMTEPTEMSVPAEAETTSVMPRARMAASLPRFKMSIRRP